MTAETSNHVTITINGKQFTSDPKATILEAARANGIEIPTLCYVEELPPQGSCRLCVVEVEGSPALVGSCHTKVRQGMVIQTHSPRVVEARRQLVELLMASHCGTCFVCDKANICTLRKIAADMNVGLPAVQVPKRFYQVEDVNRYLCRDLTKCILCRRCVTVCRDVKGASLLSVGQRGFYSKIIYDANTPKDNEQCKDCDLCVLACPTGALSKPVSKRARKRVETLVVMGK